MADEIVRVIVEEDEPLQILWDSIWINDPGDNRFGSADWVVQETLYDADGVPFNDEPRNLGGLQASDPLGTAIILCLFTDKRRPDELIGPEATERRGWHGDSFDLDALAGERELGSLLWTLERGPMTFEVERQARHYAAESLQTLIDQGVVSRFSFETEADKGLGTLRIMVRAINDVGETIFKNAYQVF